MCCLHRTIRSPDVVSTHAHRTGRTHIHQHPNTHIACKCEQLLDIVCSEKASIIPFNSKTHPCHVQFFFFSGYRTQTRFVEERSSQ